MGRLYLDCDGVLANFDEGFMKLYGIEPKLYEDRYGSQVFWDEIRHVPGGFFHHLDIMPDAMELFNAVKHLRPIILTGCPAGNWAHAQKIAWGAKHFPGIPVATCLSKNKRDFCQPGDILVDDTLKYRHLWKEAGGVFIHHTSAADSLVKLEYHMLISTISGG